MTLPQETTAPADQPVITTVRIFDAPRSIVFDAFSREENITQWWGPNGFSCLDNKYDFREGGSWSFVMHHDQYGDYPNLITYKKIIVNERIEFDHGDLENPHQHPSEIIFEDEGEKTRLTMIMHFPDLATRDETVERVGAIQGQKETFDKLETYLASREGV